ncbi:MAG: endopeptidase La [Saprospiraceae bacterium]|nr:endopeptidase La [Saprospiraceae bacterium]
MFEEYFEASNIEEEGEFMPLFSIDEEEEEPKDGADMPEVLPLLALKNTVLFPGIIIPITVGRAKSLSAIQAAYDNNRLIGVVSQRDSKIENPEVEDLFKVGTVARILKLLKLPDGSATAILQGRSRFELVKFTKTDPYLEAGIQILKEVAPTDNMEFEALISTVKDRAKNIIELSPNIPSEAVVMLKNINKDPFLLNFISSNLGIKVEAKQKVLEVNALSKKARIILDHMDHELQMLQLKDQIENKVRGDIEKQQRDYFLNQQLKTIQEELGQNTQEQEINVLAKRAKKKGWPEEVDKLFNRELKKIRRINPQVAEYSVQLNYLELLLDLPWTEVTKDNFDLKKVAKVLNRDHFGLEKVKTRIIEHLAVLKLKGDMKAPIVCLVGPPGVGKTSLGKSIATALRRKFIRMSLGGLHDESEIRGHRRTYIGAMPGRIIQSLRKAGSANPVFILDEIDKVGNNFRGDPSSALLEVLDPEQNGTFHDNYLEVEYDLSKVLFIATANSLSSIQPALLDRMEIIEIGGYSLEEKVEICKRHLIPRQRKEHGLKASMVSIKAPIIAEVIKNYTRESGVRGLNRQMAGIMRYFAKMVAMDEPYSPTLKIPQLGEILGPKKFTADYYQEAQIPGVAVGLAWTRVGGDILFIEASLSKGKGKLTLTGNLGDVMKESASTALSYLKANGESLGINLDDFEKYDIHIHVPEGAIPKDGPSAGVTMLTALASIFNKRPVKSHLAMTGEITLRGKVLPVGGIKEKILAAKRAGIKEIILCQDNQRHVDEIEKEYLKDLEIHYVSRMSEVLNLAVGF